MKRKHEREQEPEFDSLKEILAINVRNLRNAKEWSQELLAYEAKLDRTLVGRVERKKYNPSLLVLVRLSKALSVRPIDLLVAGHSGERGSGT